MIANVRTPYRTKQQLYLMKCFFGIVAAAVVFSYGRLYEVTRWIYKQHNPSLGSITFLTNANAVVTSAVPFPISGVAGGVAGGGVGLFLLLALVVAFIVVVYRRDIEHPGKKLFFVMLAFG